MSLPGSSRQIEVTILRDSGAFDSFIWQSMDTDTGKDVACGMGSTPFCDPVQNMHINCCLQSGEVTVAV